jgi:signal transduction histidine kinase
MDKREKSLNILPDHIGNSLHATIMAIALRDKRGKINDFKYVLADGQELASIPSADFKHKLIVEQFAEAKRNGLFERCINVVETGKYWQNEFHYNQNHLDIWAKVSIDKFQEGCILSFTDITRQKRSELDLTNKFESLTKILQTLSITTSIMELNNGMFNYFDCQTGFSSEKMKSVSHENFLASVYPPDREIVEKYFNFFTTAEDDQVFDVEYRSMTGLENPEWHHACGKVLQRSQDGMSTHILNVTQTITQFKRTEEQINKLTTALFWKDRELESMNSEMKTFHHITAKDYSETLRNLYTNLEFIITNDARNLSNPGRANIRRAQSGIQKMKLLTDDLTSYTGLNETKSRQQDINLSAIWQETIRDFSATIEELNIRISVEEMPSISGFPLLLSVAFHHLLDNAIKFRKQNTQHIVTVGCRQIITETTVKSAFSQNDVMYHAVSITDNGIGIPKESLDNLFDLFFRLHDKTKYKGSGIGLAVVKKVMIIHGGFVAVDSEPGVGSSFHCFFPAQKLINEVTVF